MPGPEGIRTPTDPQSRASPTTVFGVGNAKFSSFGAA